MRVRWNVLASLALAGALSLTAGCQTKKEPKTSSVRAAGGDIQVRVTENGFEPSRIEVPKGTNATLVFTRVSDTTCATEVVIAGNGARVKLPLNQPVRVALGTVNTTVPFACGMDMFKGEIVARAL